MIRDYFQESNTLCRNLLADFIYPDRSASNDKPDFTKDNGLVIAKLLAYGALYQFCKRQTRLIRRSSRFRGNKEGKRQKRKGR